MLMRPLPRVSILRNSFRYSSRAGDGVEPVVGPRLAWQAASIAHRTRGPVLWRLTRMDRARVMAAVVLAACRRFSQSSILVKRTIAIQEGTPGPNAGSRCTG